MVSEGEDSGEESVQRRGTLEDYYTLGPEIGRGTFSVVRIAIPRPNTVPAGITDANRTQDVRRAVKIINKTQLTPTQLTRVTSEVRLLRQCEHPHIIKLTEVFETQTRMCIVMELLAGGDLFDAIVSRRRYTEQEARATTHNLASAVLYLHQRGIIHRDLKPENLLLPRDAEGNILYSDVRIADFGFAKQVRGKDERLTTPCGTPAYVAPEIAMNECYTHAVDMWSVGVILYILLCGFPPFHAEDDNALLDQVASARFSFPSLYWRHISSQAKDLVRCLLVRNPYRRFSAQQVLGHPWITGICVPALGLLRSSSSLQRSSSSSITCAYSSYSPESSYGTKSSDEEENSSNTLLAQNEIGITSNSPVLQFTNTITASSLLQTSSSPSISSPLTTAQPLNTNAANTSTTASTSPTTNTTLMTTTAVTPSNPPQPPPLPLPGGKRNSNQASIPANLNTSTFATNNPNSNGNLLPSNNSSIKRGRSGKLRRRSSPPPFEERSRMGRSKTESSLWQRRRQYLQQKRVGGGSFACFTASVSRSAKKDEDLLDNLPDDMVKVLKAVSLDWSDFPRRIGRNAVNE